MKVLLTGGTSFTGLWFARALQAAGHRVTAIVRRPAQAYEGLRARRLAALGAVADCKFEILFGDERFIALAAEGFDLLAHHAATVENYRSPDFDIEAALAANTYNLAAVLEAFKSGGGRALVATGSVFEADEGIGEAPLRAFSPYGLSKSLTAAALEQGCRDAGIGYGKFVIPNPFGPLEEPRFVTYAMECWRRDEVTSVRTPDYIRDNIHVDLLALDYAAFCGALPEATEARHRAPSGYAESQGDFAERLAAQVRQRTSWRCALELLEQTDFGEPRCRINSEPAQDAHPQWSEEKAWDALVAYYDSQGTRN